MLAVPPSAAAQTTAAAGLPLSPPPPALPETISRDDQGRATVRAVRLNAPMRIDGRIDEAIYQEVRPASGFITALLWSLLLSDPMGVSAGKRTVHRLHGRADAEALDFPIPKNRAFVVKIDRWLRF